MDGAEWIAMTQSEQAGAEVSCMSPGRFEESSFLLKT